MAESASTAKATFPAGGRNNEDGSEVTDKDGALKASPSRDVGSGYLRHI